MPVPSPWRRVIPFFFFSFSFNCFIEDKNKKLGPRFQCDGWGVFSVLCDVQCDADVTNFLGVFGTMTGSALSVHQHQQNQEVGF